MEVVSIHELYSAESSSGSRPSRIGPLNDSLVSIVDGSLKVTVPPSLNAPFVGLFPVSPLALLLSSGPPPLTGPLEGFILFPAVTLLDSIVPPPLTGPFDDLAEPILLELSLFAIIQNSFHCWPKISSYPNYL